MKYLLLLFFVFNFELSKAQSITKISIDELSNIVGNNDTTYVINFWATFCAPCVAEIPDMLSIEKKYKTQKVKFIFVSLDFKENYPKKIKSFITKRKWKSNFAWLNETDANIFCPKIDSSWSGSIPATLIVNKSNGYKKFFEATIMASELEAIIKKSFEKQ